MTASARTDPAAKLYTATLVRGDTFQLLKSRKLFETGKPVAVTADEKAYLEEHAVDAVARPGDRTNPDDPLPIARLQKFVFSGPGEEAA